jgi:predicted RNase H-like HicB family nuclease
MVAMKHYSARVERSGNWWAITIDGMKGTHSQTKRLDQVEANAREVIALMTESEPDSFTVDVVHEMPPAWRKVLEHYIELSNHASELHQRVAEAQELVVRDLVADGLTVRDVGVLTGLSFQRVAQVAKARQKAV